MRRLRLDTSQCHAHNGWKGIICQVGHELAPASQPRQRPFLQVSSAIMGRVGLKEAL